jgi:16S rRNA C967 or C1407 C5-methylase (RsmB/RsmF family)
MQLTQYGKPARLQVESFLARRPDFVLDTSLPELARGVGVIDGNGYLQTLPHLHGCDGAFAARFRRVG